MTINNKNHDETAEIILEDFKIAMMRCVRCSMCKFIPWEQVKSQTFSSICPSIDRYNFHAYSGGGKLIIALAILCGRIEYTDKLIDIIYHCQMCGGCDISCKYSRDFEVLEPLYQFRKRLVENGQIYPTHILIMLGLRREDNMMNKSRAERGKWSERLDVKDITKERAEVYYHAGCLSCFDEELWPTARSAVTLLKKAGADVGIAGKEEVCCGGCAYEMGYEAEFIKYAEHNTEMLKTAGIKTVVTSCSDCYYAFKVLYDKIGKKKNLEIFHITEYLDLLIKMAG